MWELRFGRAREGRGWRGCEARGKGKGRDRLLDRGGAGDGGDDGVGWAMGTVGDWRGSALRETDMSSVLPLRAIRRIVPEQKRVVRVRRLGHGVLLP